MLCSVANICIKIMHINSRAAFPSRKVFCNVHFALPFPLFLLFLSGIFLCFRLVLAFGLAFETPLLDFPNGTVMFLFLSLHVVVLFFLSFTQINYSNFMQSAEKEKEIRGEGILNIFVLLWCSVGVASLVFLGGLCNLIL